MEYSGVYLGYSGFADSVPSAARFASKKLSMAIWIDFSLSLCFALSAATTVGGDTTRLRRRQPEVLEQASCCTPA